MYYEPACFISVVINTFLHYAWIGKDPFTGCAWGCVNFLLVVMQKLCKHCMVSTYETHSMLLVCRNPRRKLSKSANILNLSQRVMQHFFQKIRGNWSFSWGHWWRIEQKWIPVLECDWFLRFMFGATPADLFTASMIADPFLYYF